MTQQTQRQTPLIEVEKLLRVGVVVKDLEHSTRRYAEILGIDTWEVRQWTPTNTDRLVSRGRITGATFRTAVGTTTGAARPAGVAPGPDAVPVTFELIEHSAGETPFAEMRFRRGQGISHLTLARQTHAEWEVTRAALDDAGIRIAATITADGITRQLVDTRRILGGFIVEVEVADDPDAAWAVHETWDHAGTYTRPEGVGPVPVQGVGHFGVVVHDVVATIEQFGRVLGVPLFRMRDWRTEEGLLEAPYYRGEPVEHGYFTGLAPFKDFGFEVIEPTYGPSHYNREFRDVHGEGIHHMLLTVGADKEHWARQNEWLASIGIPLAMGSPLIGGSGEFCYHDTAADLGGWILEATCRHFALDPPPTPDYVIDFAALAAVL
ncbi:VOC family protein [Nocardioides sp. zg-DK7169]|uniref:VOC family protein n=1 Tax=Nocardioides sp. zg-DK7169 TaxID=2736600 RepID=UPI001553D972|nr:VOC family protein [Nocardioides sp. zg-DK7169]NPC97024.1 hypothetical protein [Nocardioides sp. zg-DK7169]